MITNLTPHGITVVKVEGEDLDFITTFPPSGQVVRLATKSKQAEPIDGIPTIATTFGKPEGLPEEEEGKYYIVSNLIKSALPERTDLLVPAEVVRDSNGQIIGCQSFSR